MTHFEYISVAIALVNALVVSRLLSGLTASLRRDAFYFTHFAWVVTLIMITIMQWWAMWALKNVEWTAPRFLWVLAGPSFLYLRAVVLLSEHPEEISSFEAHFFESRTPFFAITFLAGLWVAFSPWVVGAIPWFTYGPLVLGGMLVTGLSLVGLIFKGRFIHLVIVLLFFASALRNLLITRF
jgi:hypothetical protein